VLSTQLIEGTEFIIAIVPTGGHMISFSISPQKTGGTGYLLAIERSKQVAQFIFLKKYQVNMGHRRSFSDSSQGTGYLTILGYIGHPVNRGHRISYSNITQ
jgi:hypothetical protein